MAAAKIDVVEKIVHETVARYLGLSRRDVRATTGVDDPGTFYRVIVDIEQQLGISATKGDWSFEESTINGLVAYYRKLCGMRHGRNAQFGGGRTVPEKLDWLNGRTAKTDKAE